MTVTVIVTVTLTVTVTVAPPSAIQTPPRCTLCKGTADAVAADAAVEMAKREKEIEIDVACVMCETSETDTAHGV